MGMPACSVISIDIPKGRAQGYHLSGRCGVSRRVSSP
jgi:hypothetical protein